MIMVRLGVTWEARVRVNTEKRQEIALEEGEQHRVRWSLANKRTERKTCAGAFVTSFSDQGLS